MKRSQEIQIRQSEIRQRANELAGKETLDSNEKLELDTLMAELSTSETQYRAAVTLEGNEASEQRAANDGESAEIGRLESRAMLSTYLHAAKEGRAVEGAEADLNAAVGLSPTSMIPWAAIAPRVEARADVAINVSGLEDGNPQTQASILSRVFKTSATAALGVSLPSVPVGSASYPVFKMGTTASMAAKAAAVDAGTATFESHVLTPTRLSGAYLWSIEDTAQTRGLQESLRQDLSMVMSDLLNQQILNGDGTAPNVEGFLAPTKGLSKPGNPTVLAKYADFRKLASERVDGQYASSASDVTLIINPKTYQVADVTYRTDNSEETALQAMQSMTRTVRVAGQMPAETAMISEVLAYMGGATAAVAPIWEGVRMIRDEITLANKGQVRLQAVMLFSFAIIRAAQYARLLVKTSA